MRIYLITDTRDGRQHVGKTDGSAAAAENRSPARAWSSAGIWRRWYKENIPLADDLFDDHLRRLKRQ